MILVEELPILYGQNKNQKIKIWKAGIYQEENGKIYSKIEYGYKDSKIQEKLTLYENGKNIGKKNETSVLEQCTFEIKKKWQDKQNKEGYTLENQVNHIFYPMLAINYKENNAKYPYYIQPKLDGCRCIIYKKDNIIKFQSRTGQLFQNLDHIQNEICHLFDNNTELKLDGELYSNEMTFEKFMGLIRSETVNPHEIIKIKYHIFDIISNDSFKERFEFLNKLIINNDNYQYVKIVETNIVNNHDEMLNYHDKYKEIGYEGIMLRNIEGKYELGFRSKFLQKFKTFLESEYEIINFKKCKDNGIIWICKTLDNHIFSVKPRGTIEYRRELLNHNPEKYKGQYLTVIYQEISEKGIPRFPVGKDIRFDLI